MLKKIKQLDRKLLIYLGLGIGFIFILLILMIILKLTVSSKISPTTLEVRMKEAAQSYYKDNKKELPKNNGDVVSITINELVNAEYLKNPDKTLKNGITCKGKVNVSKNNEYYLYQPIIECSNKYKTNLLYKKIVENNSKPNGYDGLYKINNYYLFRGENPNNYVNFANKKWRILRINSDNTIRMILVDNIETTVWDDRYNTEKDENYGKNDFKISRIRDYLINVFKSKDIFNFNKNDKALIVPTELCIGSRNPEAIGTDGSIECSKKTDKMSLGLLQVNEYTIVSLDVDCHTLNDIQCQNYNFLSKLNSFWTLTADSTNSYKVYKIYGIPSIANASTYSQPKIVITISADTLYSKGKGTNDNPYIIK